MVDFFSPLRNSGKSGNYEYDNEYDNAYGQGRGVPVNRAKSLRTFNAGPALTSADKQTEDGQLVSDSDEFSAESSSVEDETQKPVSKLYRSFRLEASAGIQTKPVTISEPSLVKNKLGIPGD